MFVTLNCSVKPTAAMARIEAVMSPNPIAGTSWLMLELGAGDRGAGSSG